MIVIGTQIFIAESLIFKTATQLKLGFKL